MLEAVIEARDSSNLSAIARTLSMPVATAHRHVAALVAEGYLVAASRGYCAGPRVLRLLEQIDEKNVLASVAEPSLALLAADLGAVVQMGTFEHDMVTYRIKAGQGANSLFTQVGMQLEAYCSAIGKVLLANLPVAQRDAYLEAGPFVALTPRTITDPAVLRTELDAVEAADYAVDDGEIAQDLSCLAVPVRKPDGSVIAAISVSRFRRAATPGDDSVLVDKLHRAAAEIASAAYLHMGCET